MKYLLSFLLFLSFSFAGPDDNITAISLGLLLEDYYYLSGLSGIVTGGLFGWLILSFAKAR